MRAKPLWAKLHGRASYSVSEQQMPTLHRVREQANCPSHKNIMLATLGRQAKVSTLGGQECQFTEAGSWNSEFPN